MNKLRILHIIKSLGRGGAEMLLPETLKFHNTEQFEFHYLYFLPWKNQMVDEIEKAGGKVQCLPCSNNLQLILKYRKVIRYIKENNIQLVHCHLPWAGILGRVVHQIMGTPVLYTEHNKQERYHFITRWVNRFTFNWQNKVIAVSEEVSDSIIRNIKPDVPITKVLNGVNTDYYRRDFEAGLRLRRRLGIPDESIVIGTIAVFRFQKRLEEWIHIFLKLAEKYPNVHGIIVGDGPLKDNLHKLVSDLDLGSRITLPGLQTEVRPWLSAMDVFMMTSLFEGLPVALLEAMSTECAIVTTDAGGIREVVVDDQCGLMVPVDDLNKLESKLQSVIEEPQLRSKLGESARLRVMSSFGMQKMVSELERLYESYRV